MTSPVEKCNKELISKKEKIKNAPSINNKYSFM